MYECHNPVAQIVMDSIQIEFMGLMEMANFLSTSGKQKLYVNTPADIFLRLPAKSLMPFRCVANKHE